jgi:hypothetical protein
MAILTIGVTVFDKWLERGSLRHLSALTSEPDTLEFNLIPGAPVVLNGSPVTYQLLGGTRLFGGVVTGTDRYRAGIGNSSPVYGQKITCGDYRYICDGKLINRRFVEKSAGQILVEILGKELLSVGLGVALINTGTAPIPSIRFKNIKFSEVLDRLKGLTGFYWDIDPNKNLIFQPPGYLTNPIPLVDGAGVYAQLSQKTDRSELTNSVTIEAARRRSPLATIDYETGDNLKTNFRLTRRPFINKSYIVFKEDFGSSPDNSVWEKFSPNNPSPPAGHIPSDGYLMTTINQGGALAQSGWLQVVGGNSVWGNVRLQSYLQYQRGDGFRRFEFDFSATATAGQGRIGLWDTTNPSALLGELIGVFLDNGIVRVSIGGVTQTSLATPSYTALRINRIRITPNAGAGYTVQINQDDLGSGGATWRPSQWVTLFVGGASANQNVKLMPIFNHSFNGRVDRVRVFNRLGDFAVTVGGAAKTIGLFGEDENSGADCLLRDIDNDVPSVIFFGDSRPALNAAIVFTYYESLPTIVTQKNQQSIQAVAQIEGTDGIYQKYIKKPDVETRELAVIEAKNYLDLYSNPVVEIGFTSYNTAFRSGQLVNTNLTIPNSGLAINQPFLIHEVVTESLGSDQIRQSVRAGSRLKSAEDYLLELLKLGKKLDENLDEFDLLDELFDLDDNINPSDTLTLSSTPNPSLFDSTVAPSDTLQLYPITAQPYYYGVAVYFLSIYST